MSKLVFRAHCGVPLHYVANNAEKGRGLKQSIRSINFLLRVFYSASFMAAISAPAIVNAQDTVSNDASTGKNPVIANLVPVTENGRQVYVAAQFAQYSPQTALDIIGRIPGFNISSSSDNRGLGEASQNVLFNGQRISGKSNDAMTVLARTPAANVIRIEIADGAALNIPGLSGQVANVITKTSGISGNYSYRSQIRQKVQPQYFTFEAGIAGKLGKGDFTLGLKNNDNSYRGGNFGDEITTNADGSLLYTTARINQFSGDRPTLSGSYSRTSEAGSIFNGNAELFYNRQRRIQTFERTTPNAADISDRATGKSNERGFEISTDYEFAAAGGRLKLIGFQKLAKEPGQSTFRRQFDDNRNDEASVFSTQSKQGESVLRSEFRWKGGIADWQISAEGAYNFLDVKSELSVLDDAGIFQIEPIENATSRVAEKRGQFIASYGRPLAKNLNLQTQIGAEYSQITQTGARGLSRQFVRPKGLVSLAWKASPRLDVSARFERKVGQLDFGDFLASVDLRDANDSAGNTKLVPPQSWQVGLELNRSLGAVGSIKLKLEREWISDIIDQVAIEGGGEAPGNLDSAQRWSAEMNATLLLDKIGLKGMKFDLAGYLQRGRLRDQLFGFYRPINEERRYTYEISFRHDIPGSKWAYGAIIEDQRNAPFLRLDFAVEERNSGPEVRAYLEHNDIFGMKGRIAVVNLTQNKNIYKQVFYVDQRDGDIAEIRNGSGGSGRFLRFSLSGTF